MRIHSTDLYSQFKKGLAPIYFLFGEEPLFLTEAVMGLRAMAQKNGYTEREVVQLSNHSDCESWFLSLKCQSLFSQNRFIECRFVEGSIDKKWVTAITNYANHPEPNTLLSFIADSLEPNVWKSTAFQSMEQQLISVFARGLKKYEFAGWIENRLKRAKLPCSNEIVQTLLEYTEGNTLAASQAIEKLSLYSNNQSDKDQSSSSLSTETIKALTGFNARFTLFDLVDQVLAGNHSLSVQILNSLKQEGTEPILILWALTKELRILISLKQKAKNQANLKSFLENAGIWKRKIDLYEVFLKRTSLDFLHQALFYAKRVDTLLKSDTVEEKWYSLLTFCRLLMGIDIGFIQ